MKWFKHKTGSHDDPDISDAWDLFGEFGYVGFFVILEIYGEEYSHRDSEEFITISKTFLRRKLRKSWTKVELLLNFYSKTERVLSKNSGERIMLKIPNYIELASNWSKRLPTEATTELPTAKEVDKEVDKDIKEKVKKEKLTPKIKFLDEVFLTKKEHDRLIEDYGERLILQKIEDADAYLSQGNNRKKYTDHNKMIRNWIRRSNTPKIEKYIQTESEPVKETPEPEWADELEYFISVCQKYCFEIENNISEPSYMTWFQPLKFISETDDLITLYAPEEYMVSWINEHYSPMLKEVFKKDFIIKSVNDQR